MKKLFILLLLTSVLCTGCFSPCENCEELELKVFSLEEDLFELQMKSEDDYLDNYGNLEEISYYFSWAETYLDGQFEDVDVNEALKAVREGQRYLGSLM